MKVKLEKNDIEIIEKAEKIVGYGEREGEYTDLNDLIGIIENLLYEVDRLEEKLKDTEDYYHDNYKPIPPGQLYGVSDSMFH